MPPASYNFISDAVASLVQPDLNCSCAWFKCWLYYGDTIKSLKKIIDWSENDFFFWQNKLVVKQTKKSLAIKNQFISAFGGIYLTPCIG